MSARRLQPIHPGEILREEFLDPMGISQYRLAKDINVDPRRINAIIQGKRAITADTALRLARYDLEVERDELGDRLEKEVKKFAATG